MTDTVTPPAPGVSNVPPPPGTSVPASTAPPPGVSQPNHLPPQPPHLTIPPNNNPIPTAITSPPGQGPWGPNGPTRGPAHRSGNSTLYVGNLVPSVTVEQLREIFSATIGDRGSVQGVKIIPDKNANARGLNYGFVELSDPSVAEYAMLTLNGRRIHDMEIKINWAYMSNHSNKEDTSNHFHIFVGDLSQEVDDATLYQAFEHFGNCSEARVMWDMKTGRTRGYGFVAFRTYDAALKAISDMDGEWLGSRQIRVNWANQKGQPSINQRSAMDGMGLPVGTPYAARDGGDVNGGYRDAWNKSVNTNSTTVYVGNLTPFTTNNDLFPLFANYGPIKEIRYQSDRGYAFIKYETKEQAALAISQMNNYVFNGRALKTSWGKDRTNSGQRGNAGVSAGVPPPASPYVHDGGYVGGYPPSAGPGSAVPPTPGSYYPPPGNPTMSPAVPTPGGYNYTPQGQYGSPSTHGAPPSYPMPGSAGGYGRNDYQAGQWGGSPAGYGPNYNQSNYGGQYSSGGYNQGYSGQYNQGYSH